MLAAVGYEPVVRRWAFDGKNLTPLAPLEGFHGYTTALAFHPKALVLDEPFSGLDALVRDDFIQGMLERAEGTTIFISSHDLAEIESFASHVGYLEGGRLRFSEEMGALAGRFRLQLAAAR